MKLQTLSLAAMLALAGPAFADTVVLDAFTFKPAKKVTTLDLGDAANSRADIRAGQFSGLLNGNSFTTYCTDLPQNIRFGVTYTDFSVVSGLTAWGAQKSKDLDRMMSSAMMSGVPTDSAQSAAVQAAIWEVIYEKPGNPYDLGAGSFKVTSADASTQNYMNGIPWGSISQTPIAYHVDKLYSREHQDLMVITQVPEPGSLALLTAGLVGIGFISRRRAKEG